MRRAPARVRRCSPRPSTSRRRSTSSSENAQGRPGRRWRRFAAPQLGSDALDEARREIPFETAERVRRKLDERFNPELLPVLPVLLEHAPDSHACADRRGREAAHDGQPVRTPRHGELDDAIARCRTLERHPLDDAFEADFLTSWGSTKSHRGGEKRLSSACADYFQTGSVQKQAVVEAKWTLLRPLHRCWALSEVTRGHKVPRPGERDAPLGAFIARRARHEEENLPCTPSRARLRRTAPARGSAHQHFLDALDPCPARDVERGSRRHRVVAPRLRDVSARRNRAHAGPLRQACRACSGSATAPSSARSDPCGRGSASSSPRSTRARWSRRSIRSVTKSNYPIDRLEIIVVDDGSRDDTFFHMQRLRREFPSLVRLIRFSSNRGKRAALEAGFRDATGEIVVTIDSDSEVEPKTVAEMVTPFLVDPQVGGVAGRVTVLNRDTTISRMLEVQYALAFDFGRAAQSAYRTVACCPGALSAFRLSTILPHLTEWTHQTFLGRLRRPWRRTRH